MTAGANFLAKARILRALDLGGITDIVQRRPEPKAKEVIIVAGTAGAVFLELDTYEVKKAIRFNDGKAPFMDHRVVDADGDGNVEFFREACSASSPASLHDYDGHLLWSCTAPGSGFPHSAFGDLEGDGTIGFLLWSYISERVELRNHQGKVRWSQRWEVGPSEVRILDTDGDRKSEIVYIDGSALCIRDKEGKLLTRQPFKDASYVNALHLARYPNPDGRRSLCVGLSVHKPFRDPDQIYRMLELDGKTVVKDLGSEELNRFVVDRAVEFSSQGEGLQATVEEIRYQGHAIAGFSSTRLVLAVRDRSMGELKYREVIASSEGEVAKGDGSLAVVYADSGREARLLVGYGPDLWEYRLKQP